MTEERGALLVLLALEPQPQQAASDPLDRASALSPSVEFPAEVGVLPVEGAVHQHLGVPLDRGHRGLQFDERRGVERVDGDRPPGETPLVEPVEAAFHPRFEVLREPRRRAELRRVRHLVEGDPAPKSREVDVERRRGRDDVRVDEVEPVIDRGLVGQEEGVVLSEDVAREEAERERHGAGVGDPREVAGEPLRVRAGGNCRAVVPPGRRLDRCHHVPEGVDAGVDPVVAVLDLDRVGHLEVDAGHLAEPIAGVANVLGVSFPFGVGERDRAGFGARFGGRGGPVPVDDAGPAGRGDRPEASEDVHGRQTARHLKSLVSVRVGTSGERPASYRRILAGSRTVVGMRDFQRTFLDDLLSTASPSGFEAPSQRVWTEYVREFADEVSVDAYGNAVAVHEGDPDAPTVALTGHADEIGFIVRDVLDDGFLRIARIGGSDRTVSKGQHVTVHADEPVQGVIGQTAIHLRDPAKDEYEEISGQFVDIGAPDAETAREHVEVGDPVTFSTDVEELVDDRIAARGIDNRAGTWAAAEGLRRAADRDVDATVYAVSTVQEEVGLKGAQMVGVDLDAVDAFVAVDVTHATDNPDVDRERQGPVELGAGPVIGRGSANHPALVDLARESATGDGIDVQLQAAGTRTGTDADAFYTARGGVPSLTVSIPNRYMHTPVEVIDTGDLNALADLLAAIANGADDAAPFGVDV